MNISHDVLAIVLLEWEFGFEPGPMGRLVAADRTCRRLAGGIWQEMRLGQVRRLLTAYYDRIVDVYAYSSLRLPTVAAMLLRLIYLHEPDGPVALSPLRLHLAEQIKRLGLGLAEAVTAENCGNILLEIDAELNGELSSSD